MVNQPIGNHGMGIFWCGPLLQGQTRVAKLKSAYNSLITHLLLVCNVKSTYRKSGARNFFDVIRFDLWPLFQGQMRIAKINSV